MVRPEDTTVRYDPVSGPPRRVVFEPRDDGCFRRVEETWTGCRWRQTGSELVEKLAIVAPDGTRVP